jgi:hypothetical protein
VLFGDVERDHRGGALTRGQGGRLVRAQHRGRGAQTDSQLIGWLTRFFSTVLPSQFSPESVATGSAIEMDGIGRLTRTGWFFGWCLALAVAGWPVGAQATLIAVPQRHVAPAQGVFHVEPARHGSAPGWILADRWPHARPQRSPGAAWGRALSDAHSGTRPTVLTLGSHEGAFAP